MLRTLILLSLVLAALLSCTSDPIDVKPATPGGNSNTGGNNGGGPNPADTALCFERDILPIFISNCAISGCHDAATAKEGYVFTSYKTITSKKFRSGNARDTELYEKITEHDNDDVMPPPPRPRLSSRQIALIGRWIDEGAPNTTNCPPLCDSTKFGFAADIQPLLNTFCGGCHSSAAPSGGIALDNYSGVRSVVLNGRLIGAVMHSPGYKPMPQGGSKLSDCNISQIRGWIQAGAPNN